MCCDNIPRGDNTWLSHAPLPASIELKTLSQLKGGSYPCVRPDLDIYLGQHRGLAKQLINQAVLGVPALKATPFGGADKPSNSPYEYSQCREIGYKGKLIGNGKLKVVHAFSLQKSNRQTRLSCSPLMNLRTYAGLATIEDMEGRGEDLDVGDTRPEIEREYERD